LTKLEERTFAFSTLRADLRTVSDSIDRLVFVN